MSTAPTTTLALRSLVRPDGTLELSLAEEPVPVPGADEVVVEVAAAPMNPSDLGLLLASADLGTTVASGTPTRPVVTATIPDAALRGMAGRMGTPMPIGNEGAGVVVAAGTSAAAQALLGRTVAAIGGAMYTGHRCLRVDQCLVLPEGTTPAEGTSAFVNPLTVLGMLETMRLEGHRALVHTAAASNLGQMLQRACLEDGVGLVNVVRRPEQAEVLRAIGAVHVCDSSAPSFMADLTDAIAATGATLAFDAIGGGRIAGQLLSAMEAALARVQPTTAASYSRYGSNVPKQVYIYGSLDRGPTEIARTFGMSWNVGGWLLFPFLDRIGKEETRRLEQRVAAGITTTFASSYTKIASFTDVLGIDEIAVYSRQATGTKYLLDPTLPLG